MRISIKIAFFALLISFFSSCDDLFNPDTAGILLEKEYIGDYTELYSGYMGIAGAVQSVADQASFLEGLRGDLLEPTANAPREIWDVYNRTDLTGNTFASPKGYYNVIINANDYISHAAEYRRNDSTSVSDETFKGLVSGAIRFKVWAYLQLAKIYGEAVYFDTPVTSYGQLQGIQTSSFDEIIDKCVDLMVNGQRVIYEKDTSYYNGLSDVIWSSELFPGQSASATSLSWDRICPAKQCILAELYLYKNDYEKVVSNCIEIIRKGGENEASYQLNLSEYNGEWKNFGYTFTRKEHICVQFYDYTLGQKNRYIDYYSSTYPNKYYLKPTAQAINRFETQTMAGIPGDKYRGSGVSYKLVGSDYVFYKFLNGNLSSDKIYTNDVMISLYRAAEIHLFLVEALVGLGRFTEALAFLNDGIGSYYNTPAGKFNPPFDIYPNTLYRTATTSEMANRGIRGRVACDPVGTFANIPATPTGILRNIQRLDSLIVEEYCLEFAGEGKALYAMNRMARRWSVNADKSWAASWGGNSNPENLWGTTVQQVWAKKIAAKYNNNASVEAALATDLNNWFIKYPLTE
jgi:starch-binding outer membrane protein, SusD/RagB family